MSYPQSVFLPSSRFPSHMKSSRLLFAFATFALALLLALAITTPASASNKKKSTPDDTRILIDSVDASANTITVKIMTTKTTKIYKVDSSTTITVNGQAGKLSDITSGLQVRDMVERDSESLDSISVSPADPAPKASKN